MSERRAGIALCLCLFGCGQARESRAALVSLVTEPKALAATISPGPLSVPEHAQARAGNALVTTTAQTEPASFEAVKRASAHAPACPNGMAHIDGYCIDRYEAYVVELDASEHESAHSPYLPVDGLRVRAKVADGVLPQGYISQVQAKAACENAGKRLCTAPELSLACRGPNHSATYPYGGNKRQAGKCNEGKGSAVSVVFGSAANYGNVQLNDPRLNQWPGGLAKTGAYADSVSPFGVYDLVGNLHEWSAEVAPNGHGFFHGGFYGDAEVNGSGCDYVTKAHSASYHDYSTGFRCCSDPSE